MSKGWSYPFNKWKPKIPNRLKLLSMSKISRVRSWGIWNKEKTKALAIWKQSSNKTLKTFQWILIKYYHRLMILVV